VEFRTSNLLEPPPTCRAPGTTLSENALCMEIVKPSGTVDQPLPPPGETKKVLYRKPPVAVDKVLALRPHLMPVRSQQGHPPPPLFKA
jgi:hypothetical protein